MKGRGGATIEVDYDQSTPDLPVLLRLSDGNGHVTNVTLSEEAALHLATLLLSDGTLRRYGLLRMVQGVCLGILAAFGIAKVLA